MKKIFASVFLTSCALGTIAWAQTVVTANQGQPGKQGPWPVTLQGSFFADGGGIPVFPTACASITQTVTATVDGGAWVCPTTQQTGRRWITMCNSQENSNTVNVKIRFDGTAPAAGITTKGDVLGLGDCLTLPLTSTTAPICIDSNAGAASLVQQALTTFECAF